MNLDLRLPMGLMFTLTGLILFFFGLATQGSPIYEKSLGFNANLIWGVVLLIFGALMLMLGKRGQQKIDQTSAQSLPKVDSRKGHGG